MDRDKQIEEMAKIMSLNCGECYTCKVYGKGSKDIPCTDFLVANEIYEQGYRKITDNEVVISNEEYDKIWLNGWNEGYSEILVDIKKTARDIFEKCIAKLNELITTSYEKSIKANGGYHGGANNAFHICKENLKELAEKYGVDLGGE